MAPPPLGYAMVHERRGWIVAVAALLVGPAAAGHLADGPTPQSAPALNCGNLSPFGNTCQDDEWVLLSNAPTPDVNITGFVGRLTLTLKALELWGERFSITWTCDALLVEATPLTTCSGPTVHGRPRVGWPVTLRCDASARSVLGLAAAPPTGPWGCWVVMANP
jgi:hypothetical protein